MTAASIKDLYDFCRIKPADEEYEWLSPRDCAIGQYAKSIGSDYFQVCQDIGGYFDNKSDGPFFPLPRTFGAATERLKKKYPEKIEA